MLSIESGIRFRPHTGPDRMTNLGLRCRFDWLVAVVGCLQSKHTLLSLPPLLLLCVVRTQLTTGAFCTCLHSIRMISQGRQTGSTFNARVILQVKTSVSFNSPIRALHLHLQFKLHTCALTQCLLSGPPTSHGSAFCIARRTRPPPLEYQVLIGIALAN